MGAASTSPVLSSTSGFFPKQTVHCLLLALSGIPQNANRLEQDKNICKKPQDKSL